MLTISIMLAFVVALCAAQAVCISRLAERIEKLKKELSSWKLAAEHWEKEARGW